MASNLFTTNIDQLDLTSTDLSNFSIYCNAVSSNLIVDKKVILATLPLTQAPSYAPLSLLSSLISSQPGSWPVFELIRTHAQLWKALPEAAKAGRTSSHATLIQDTLTQVKASYSSLADLYFAVSDKPAIYDPETQKYLTHRKLHSFLRQFRLPITRSEGEKPIIAVALPNGPLLGLAVLAVATYYTAAPVNAAVGSEQFKADIVQSGAKVILVIKSDVKKLGLTDAWVAEAGIKVFILSLDVDMTIGTTCLDGLIPSVKGDHLANTADDTAIMLFTSGTSGTKKLVPLSTHAIVSGVAFVIESWGLTDAERCLNMMPLNHVGGIVRNLFAPVMSGGSTVCCAAFDPNQFWDVVEDLAPTWYYASPSMHSMILEAAADRPDALAKSQIRLVCNAAGGLLPSLACQIRDTFKCIVLPSYGMTECMPISTPPLGYLLDRSGTSGVSVGPEIAILDGNDNLITNGTVGRISVRGSPVFGGYLKPNGTLDLSPFTADGWFDTGDMGYLDTDGYLYVTGRSKEVINRGGELISPFEVEEAIVIAAQKHDSPIFGRVSQALAFSLPHDVLQEVVGIVLVTPPGAPRADLRAIQEALKLSLHSVKVPVFAVYMDNVPKGNNKVLRIKLAERMNLETICDRLPMAERHYEAICPPPNTALTVKIECEECIFDYQELAASVSALAPAGVDVFTMRGGSEGYPQIYLAPKAGSSRPNLEVVDRLQTTLRVTLDGYLVSDKLECLDRPFPITVFNTVDETKLLALTAPTTGDLSYDRQMSVTQRKVSQAFASVLGGPGGSISASSDFFEMGGDSLRAGKLLAVLRKEFQLRLPVDMLFTNGQVGSLSELIDERLDDKTEAAAEKVQIPLPGCEKTHSSTNPFLLLAQLIPICIVYPMKRALTWVVWMYMITETQTWVTNNDIPGRLFNLILSLAIANTVTQVVAPICGILAKWCVIGAHKEGMYPMWGLYHTRWWLAHKIVNTAGCGVFRHFNSTRVLYYRLLGAKIGKGVSISKYITTGEWDLLTIEDGVNLDGCICRPFAAERNTSMYLGRIHLGKNSHVGLKAIVAAGTSLPENACIGPNSSSWEINDATEANRQLSSSKIVKAHPLVELCTIPIKVLVKFCGALPWIAGLAGIVINKAIDNAAEKRHVDHLAIILHWFATPKRLAYHYLAVVLNVSIGPIFLFLVVLVVRFMLQMAIGKTVPGSAAKRNQMQRFKKSLMNSIMSNGQLHKLTELFGQHYEVTSIAVRLLGGKVGKRVYWPGTGPTIGDYDLVDIGDDVVFGSRAHLVTSDGTGSEVIRIGNNAMVSDRVVLLPGVTLGDRCVMGSGAMTVRGTSYAPDTTWVGSKNGEAVCLTQVHRNSNAEELDPLAVRYTEDEVRLGMSGTSTAIGSAVVSTENLYVKSSSEKKAPLFTTSMFDSSAMSSTTVLGVESEKETTVVTKEVQSSSSPFGRAFYEGKAPYHVFGLPMIFFYSTFITIFVAFYWNVASTASVQVVSALLDEREIFLRKHWYRPLIIYAVFTLTISILQTAQALLAILIVIASKWALLGRREVGSYDWDKSSYCQRWQLFLVIEKLRRNCYGGQGIMGMLTSTHFAVLYFRALGATIGQDCALFAGGMPSLMFTEPDLLVLGDRVAVDDASLVSHINTKGHFTLNPLNVGERSVLRSGSRLLSGAQMDNDACLLEHTLVMAGDVVDEGVTMQGWPADAFEQARTFV